MMYLGKLFEFCPSVDKLATISIFTPLREWCLDLGKMHMTLGFPTGIT